MNKNKTILRTILSYSVRISLKNRKTAYLGTKTFRRTNSGGLGYDNKRR